MSFGFNSSAMLPICPGDREIADQSSTSDGPSIVKRGEMIKMASPVAAAVTTTKAPPGAALARHRLRRNAVTDASAYAPLRRINSWMDAVVAAKRPAFTPDWLSLHFRRGKFRRSIDLM
jgi:hypothetical protein